MTREENADIAAPAAEAALAEQELAERFFDAASVMYRRLLRMLGRCQLTRKAQKQMRQIWHAMQQMQYKEVLEKAQSFVLMCIASLVPPQTA